MLSLNFLPPQPSQDSHLLEQLGFVPGLPEILMLRQVHALEHATVWLLSEGGSGPGSPTQPDDETLGGLSTERGFYLYGSVSCLELQRAVRQALQRLKGGEWQLALHPRCSTNLSATLFLTAGFALGAHLLFPRGPVEQLLGLSLAATAAVQLGSDFGMSAQRYLTTAIPFNLELTGISPARDFWGRPAYFVGVRWQQLQ